MDIGMLSLKMPAISDARRISCALHRRLGIGLIDWQA
jgi:hypothetical protein